MICLILNIYVMRSPYALAVLARGRAKDREKEQEKLNSLMASLDLAHDSVSIIEGMREERRGSYISSD